MRPVFDASAKETGTSSLNEKLHTGPNLLSVIYDILLRFSLHKVVVMSDIKQAFHNVVVHPDHVDFLRFLWRENGVSDVITTYRFLVVVFGLTPSPFLLLATIQYHCEKMIGEGRIDEEFVRKFLKSLYMDDNISGAESVDDAFEIYEKSKSLMASAGFTLRKWSSNSKELVQRIQDAESIKNPTDENLTPVTHLMSYVTPTSPYKSVLGIKYDIDTDEIIYDFTHIIEMAQTKEDTKRNVLSIVSSIYDPPGRVAPITSQGKVVFQLLCTNKSNNVKSKWDDKIPDEIAVLWKKFVKLVTAIKVIKLKRCVIPELIDSIISICWGNPTLLRRLYNIMQSDGPKSDAQPWNRGGKIDLLSYLI